MSTSPLSRCSSDILEIFIDKETHDQPFVTKAVFGVVGQAQIAGP